MRATICFTEISSNEHDRNHTEACRDGARVACVSMIYVNSEPTLSKLIGDLRELWREHKFLRVSIKTGKDRSLDQNAISHAWYQQIATELREQTVLQIKAECKLIYGVPILRAEEEDFRAFSNMALKRLTYEQRLETMKFVPVTSIMTVDQLSQYLVAMQKGYQGRVALSFPEEAP